MVDLCRLQFGEGRIKDTWETVQNLKSSTLAVDIDAEVENLLGFILLAQRKTEDAAIHFIRRPFLIPGWQNLILASH